MTELQQAHSDVTPGFAAHDGSLYVAWPARWELNLAASGDGGHHWGPALPTGEFSYQGPALCSFNGRLYIAWTGTDEARLLNVMSTADGGHTWQNKVTLEENSRYGPALTVFDDRLYVSWTGFDHASTLNLMLAADGINFGGTKRILFDMVSSGSPALATVDDALFIAWTDDQGQLRINSSPDGRIFNLPVPLIGIDKGPGIVAHAESFAGPALQTLVFAESGDTAMRIYWCDDYGVHRINTMSSTHPDQLGPSFEALEVLPDSSPAGPATAALSLEGGPFFLAYVRGDDHNLNVVAQ
jgi:hypothetical protein